MANQRLTNDELASALLAGLKEAGTRAESEGTQERLRELWKLAIEVRHRLCPAPGSGGRGVLGS